MVTKNRMPPRTKRGFRNPWAELDYLCEKVKYWLYDRKQSLHAQRYLNRLEEVLNDLPANDLAIIRQEGLALASELRGDLGKAIFHRRNEIELIERLHREAQQSTYDAETRAYMLSKRGPATLSARRRLFGSLVKQHADQNGKSAIHSEIIVRRVERLGGAPRKGKL